VVAKRILACSLLAAISLLLACGGSSSSNNSSSQASVSIALKSALTSTTVPVGSTTGIQFTPVVNNDSGDNGVDWALTCSNSMPPLSNAYTGVTVSNSCGALSICSGTGTCAMHSASGTAVTYIPPADMIGGNLTVNVTAFATADHSQNISTAVTVSSYPSALSGTYVFQVQGSDFNASPYQMMGILVFDGKGNITAGQETINDSSATTVPGFSTAYVLQPSSSAASTYFIGPDGRGTIVANFQPAGASSTVTPFTETFSIAVISSSEALIAENDLNCTVPPSGTCPAPNAPFGATGSGTLELQDAKAASAMPGGAYAFVTSGTDSGTNPNFGFAVPTAIGGIFNVDNNPATGDISGNGSLADQDYYDSKLKAEVVSCVPPIGLTGNITQPSSMGVVTITLTGQTCFGLTTPATAQFAGYIVDSQHIRLIETDDVSGSGGFLTSGIAVSQGSSAGSFTDASLSGNYVFSALGFDSATFGAVPDTFTSVGALTSDGNGDLTGITDTFYGGEFQPFAATAVSGTYTIDSYGAGGTAGLGRLDLSLKLTASGVTKPKPTILWYLTGNGTAPLVMYAGDSDPNYPAVGAGIAYPQASGSLLNFGNPETYGISITQYNGSENDGSGAITARQNSQPPPQWEFTGTVDDTSNNNFLGLILPALDSYAPPADSFGRVSGTLLNNFVSGSNGPFYEYYLVGDNQGFFVETDLAITGTTALGYFTQACDVTSKTSCQQAADASKRAANKNGLKSQKKNRQ
jgi:hypothetical protein